MTDLSTIKNLSGKYKKYNEVPAQKEYDYVFDFGLQVTLDATGAPTIKFEDLDGKISDLDFELLDADLFDHQYLWIKVNHCERKDIEGNKYTLIVAKKEIFGGTHDKFEPWKKRLSLNNFHIYIGNEVTEELLLKWGEWFGETIKIPFPGIIFPSPKMAASILRSEWTEPEWGFYVFNKTKLREKSVELKDADQNISLKIIEIDWMEFYKSVNYGEFEEKDIPEKQRPMAEKWKLNNWYQFAKVVFYASVKNKFVQLSLSRSEVELTSNIEKYHEDLIAAFINNPDKDKCKEPNW